MPNPNGGTALYLIECFRGTLHNDIDKLHKSVVTDYSYGVAVLFVKAGMTWIFRQNVKNVFP